MPMDVPVGCTRVSARNADAYARTRDVNTYAYARTRDINTFAYARTRDENTYAYARTRDENTCAGTIYGANHGGAQVEAR